MAEPVDALEALGRAIVDSALTVHKHLGPGLLESVYEQRLARELEKRHIAVARQVPVPMST